MEKRIRNIEISKSDRIFARFIQGGRILAEFMLSGIESLKEIIIELRRHGIESRGLGRLYVRNQSRGWSIEQDLMIHGFKRSLL